VQLMNQSCSDSAWVEQRGGASSWRGHPEAPGCCEVVRSKRVPPHRPIPAREPATRRRPSLALQAPCVIKSDSDSEWTRLVHPPGHRGCRMRGLQIAVGSSAQVNPWRATAPGRTPRLAGGLQVCTEGPSLPRAPPSRPRGGPGACQLALHTGVCRCLTRPQPAQVCTARLSPVCTPATQCAQQHCQAVTSARLGTGSRRGRSESRSGGSGRH
jgi:hypothetical protein